MNHRRTKLLVLEIILWSFNFICFFKTKIQDSDKCNSVKIIRSVDDLKNCSVSVYTFFHEIEKRYSHGSECFQPHLCYCPLGVWFCTTGVSKIPSARISWIIVICNVYNLHINIFSCMPCSSTQLIFIMADFIYILI